MSEIARVPGVSVLADLRHHLHAWPDGDAAEAWIAGPEFYAAIRLCLLARDKRRAARHGVEAEALFGMLVAEYARRGAYAAVACGQLVYHAPSLADAAATLES